ncbi:MAG: hypothetical protein M3146_06760 [Thermoproteota archaeon]|nr:hypothetical protein [Thermoproteota archaeon]
MGKPVELEKEEKEGGGVIEAYILLARRSVIEQNQLLWDRSHVVTRGSSKQSKLSTKFNVSNKVTEPNMLNIYQLCFPKFISYG